MSSRSPRPGTAPCSFARHKIPHYRHRFAIRPHPERDDGAATIVRDAQVGKQVVTARVTQGEQGEAFTVADEIVDKARRYQGGAGIADVILKGIELRQDFRRKNHRVAHAFPMPLR